VSVFYPIDKDYEKEMIKHGKTVDYKLQFDFKHQEDFFRANNKNVDWVGHLISHHVTYPLQFFKKMRTKAIRNAKLAKVF